MFELHSNLQNHAFIIDLPICQILLEDRVDYPWILLVPRRSKVAKIIDLSLEDQMQLMLELDAAQRILWKLFNPKQLNVAAIGNKTPQLHFHVIVRQLEDPAWPHTVWDHPVKTPYDLPAKNQMVQQLKIAFEEFKRTHK